MILTMKKQLSASAWILLFGSMAVLASGFSTRPMVVHGRNVKTTEFMHKATSQEIPALESEMERQGNSPNANTETSTRSRRQVLSSLFAAVAAVPTTLTLLPTEPSQATYTSYTRREQDWQERQANGDVQYSSARQLRQQLRELVPQNSDNSRIFCPNGPSAAVSPLMENKCGDRQAMPSVYGRSNDAMGNSIPGFSDQWMQNQGGNIAEGTGGFPEYAGVGKGRK